MQEEASLREAHYSFQMSCAEIRDRVKFWFVGDPQNRIRSAGRETPLHQHHFYELIYVLDGEMTHHLENGTFRYRKGDVCIMNPNIRHCEGHETDCTLIFLYFKEEFLESLFASTKLSPPVPQFSDGPIFRFYQENRTTDIGLEREYLDFARIGTVSGEREEELLNSIARELICSDTGYAFRIQAFLLQLFEALEDPARYHLSRIRVDSSSEGFIFTRLMRCLEAKKGRASREELAALLHYSGDYLNRIARRQSGMSLLELGQSIMIREARHLLTDTDMTVSAIIAELGFVNRTHFYRLFEKYTGLSPVEYRTRSRT